jgi:hypothetical protein
MAGETVLEVVPTTAWQPGSYFLAVDRALEDSAGNSVTRPFDRDLGDESEILYPAAFVLVEFRCG